jgi:hypothetical protein
MIINTMHYQHQSFRAKAKVRSDHQRATISTIAHLLLSFIIIAHLLLSLASGAPRNQGRVHVHAMRRTAT